MVRFYSNENFAVDFVLILRRFGHDVLTSSDAGEANRRIPDDAVLQFAIAQDRVVITFNRDDFIALHRSFIDHPGIIVCKDDRDYEGQAMVLQAWLDRDDVLKNRCLRIKKENRSGLGKQVFVVQEYFK
jgi:hypothetical protein